jgi:hypothetical protein
MTTRSKRFAATCLVAVSIYAGTVVASERKREPDPPISNDSMASGAEQDEHKNLPSRFSAANVHPSQDQVNASETAQSLPVGPQYTISQHVTLGGSLSDPYVSDLATAPDQRRYVFGLRITF